MMRTILAILLAASAGPALAAMATGDQIRQALAGNTIEGAYAEFYSPDGTIIGTDYRAKWSVEGDSLCWVYAGSPKDCWNVEISGSAVTWVKDGQAKGGGNIIKGNPNNLQ